MRPVNFDAVIFDLDGVITDTARVHAAAWKALFDDYLRSRAAAVGEEFIPFALHRDYLEYVDGKPRYEGVRSFLLSRGIVIPDGDPNDPPELETVCALGNRKDGLFVDVLSREGVAVFDSTIRLVEQLRDVGVRRAVVSSSKNCRRVLQIADLEALFEARVDGEVSARLGLRGKPNPDIFVRCAEELGVLPARGVVVEDAISGVQAGRNGGFGLVIGVDRTGIGSLLKESGAHVVVADLAGVTPDVIDRWCAASLAGSREARG